ncbi:D-galactonate transporter [Aquisphaera giovannonii]|uniref:D-galactonate transporter n=1 Tax=Aquisphaera giovannonii TaxID=406548 RepID=A0A5B9W1A2_9BACT|nr:MFS transporter [Aquisphaera giovannonii]QEH34432.1 D-galactonate transporter [Aquisphaera giovannonii]
MAIESHPAMPGPSEGRARRSPSILLALLMAFAFAGHFNRVSMATAADARIMEQYRIDPRQMGSVYSAFLLAYTLCMIPAGWFIDRFGAAAALAVVGFGSAAFGAMTGAIGLAAGGASPLLAFWVVRALMGAVSAPLHPACARMVSDTVAAGSRSRANGLITGAALTGIAVTHPAFGAMVDRLDWPMAFLASGAATAALAALWVACTRGTPSGAGPNRPAPEAPGEGSLRSIRARSLLALTLSYAAVGYFQYLFFYWMDYYFLEVRGLDAPTSRLYASIPPMTMAFTMPLGGWISDGLERSGRGASRRAVVPVAGLALGAVFLALGIASVEPTWVVLWFALALGSVGAGEGPFWVTATELGGHRGGTSAALFNTGGNIGGMLAPIVTPWVGEALGWPWAIGLGGVICLLGAGCWLGVDAQGSTGGQD